MNPGGREFCIKCGAALHTKEKVNAGWASGGGLRYRNRPPVTKSKGNFRGFALIVSIIVTGVLLVSLGGVTNGSGIIGIFTGLENKIGTLASSIQSGGPQSGTFIVTCSNCTGEQYLNFTFFGFYGGGGARILAEGNGTQNFTISRDNANPWIVNYQFQKTTIQGILNVEFILNNGQVVEDNSTTQSYGVVSGQYLTSS
jgi:hypothetical protein